MTEDLPEPLIGAEVDLSGLDGFMLNVQRLFASELWAVSSGDEFKAALALWGRAWQQAPPGSLPNDDKTLAAFSGAGAKWKKVRAMALHGFILCNDGRLYHGVLCEDVLTAHRKRQAFRERTKTATEARRNRNDTPNQRRDDQRNGQRNGQRNDDRNDQRNVDDEPTVTTNVTSVQRRRRRRRQEHRAAQPLSLEPPRAPEPDAAAAPESLKKQHNYDEIEKLCREAGGLENDPRPGFLVLAPIIGLLDAGYDLRGDILPIIKAVVRRGQKVKSWGYFVDAIKDARAQRSGVAANIPSVAPVVETIEARDARLARQWGHWKKFDAWPFRGPRPGMQGCEIPTEKIEEWSCVT